MTVISTLVTYSNPKAQYKHVAYRKRRGRCTACQQMIEGWPEKHPAVVNQKMGEVFHEACFEPWWKAYKEELTSKSAKREAELIEELACALFINKEPKAAEWDVWPTILKEEYFAHARCALAFLRKQGALI